MGSGKDYTVCPDCQQHKRWNWEKGAWVHGNGEVACPRRNPHPMSDDRGTDRMNRV